MQGGRFGTTFQAAVFNKHITIMQLLLDGEAKINTENLHGQLILYCAMRGNQKLAMEYILEHDSGIDFA